MQKSSKPGRQRPLKFEIRLNQGELEILDQLCGGKGNRGEYVREKILRAKPTPRRRRTIIVMVPNPRLLWLLEKIRVSVETWEEELHKALAEKSESDLLLLQIELIHITRLLESIAHASRIHKEVPRLPAGIDRQQEPEKTSATRSPQGK